MEPMRSYCSSPRETPQARACFGLCTHRPDTRSHLKPYKLRLLVLPHRTSDYERDHDLVLLHE